MIGPWAAGKSTIYMKIRRFCIQNNIKVGNPEDFYKLDRRKKFATLLMLLGSDLFRSSLVFAILIKSYLLTVMKDSVATERRAMIRSFATHYVARAYLQRNEYDIIVWEGEYHHIPAIGLNKKETGIMCRILAKKSTYNMNFCHITNNSTILLKRIISDESNKINTRFKTLTRKQIDEYLSEYLGKEELMLKYIISEFKNSYYRVDVDSFDSHKMMQYIKERNGWKVKNRLNLK